jgi:O-antigen/teichoic acid export membrane protein
MIRQHGKWALISDYSDTAIGSVKPWLIGYFISIEAVGIFSAAVTLLSALSNILPLSQVLASVLPRQAGDRERLVFFSNRSIKYTTWAYALLAVGVLVSAPIAIPLLLPQYAPAIPLLYVLLLSLVSLAWSDTGNTLLNVLRSQKFGFFANTTVRIISLFCVLPFGLIFFGVWGAVIDQLFTSYTITVLRMWYVRRALPKFGPRLREFITFDAFDRNSLMRILRYIGLKRSI